MLQQFLKFIKLTPKLTAILGAMFVLLAQINGTPLFERDTHAKPENAVRIMSFNILSERFGENSVINRKEAVAKTIAEYYPDSFGAQECTTLWMAYLKQQLPEYGSVGELSTEVPFLGGYSPVFYLKNKYDVVDSGTFWLSEIPDVSSLGWDAGSIRVCTWVILQNKLTGEQYAHINTHLDNKGEMARQKGLAMVMAKAAEFDIPVVCTGDFNFREDSANYKTLTSGLLKDSKFLAPDTMSNTTYNAFKPPAEQTKIIIDFVLVNSKATPLVYRVVTEGVDGQFVSDHYPVYADMVMNGVS